MSERTAFSYDEQMILQLFHRVMKSGVFALAKREIRHFACSVALGLTCLGLYGCGEEEQTLTIYYYICDDKGLVDGYSRGDRYAVFASRQEVITPGLSRFTDCTVYNKYKWSCNFGGVRFEVRNGRRVFKQQTQVRVVDFYTYEFEYRPGGLSNILAVDRIDYWLDFIRKKPMKEICRSLLEENSLNARRQGATRELRP